MIHRVLTFFILLVLSTSKGQDICNLRCWLYNMELHVPTIKGRIAGFVDFTADNVVCRQITVEGINTSYNGNQYNISTNGLGINCTGDWELGQQFLGAVGQGSISFVVFDSALAFTLSLFNDSDGLAGNAIISPCLATLNIKDLDFHLANAPDWISRIINDFLGLFVSLIKGSLESSACQELENLAAQNLTQLLREIDFVIKPYLQPVIIPGPPVTPPGMTVLTHSPVVQLGQYFLNDVVGVNGTLNINTIINTLFEDGKFSYNNSNLNITFVVPDYGNVTFGLISLNVSGLNTWSEFSMLKTVPLYSPYVLKTVTTLDKLNISLDFSVEVVVNGSIKDKTLYEEGSFFLELENNNMRLMTQVAMIEEYIYNLLTNPAQIIDDPMSLLIPFKAINFTELQLLFKIDTILLRALSGDIEKDFDEAIDNLLALLTTQFEPAVPAFFDGYLSGPIRLQVNQFMYKTLDPFRNMSVPDQTQDDNGFDLVSTIVGATTTGVIFIATVILLCYYERKKVKEPEKKSYQCIAVSKHLPLVLRLGIPLLILGNIALFISSNTGVGATVYIVVTFNGTEVQMPSLFSFSLANSIRDMWTAEVYALSLLIAVFSGAWPYLKLVLMFISWVVPAQILIPSRREKVIMFLDALGKWSLIDAYVLTLMLVAFRFQMAPEQIESRMDVFVAPKWGFYCFLFATMLSLILTHTILASHRKVITDEKKDKKEAERSYSGKKALCTIAFTGDYSRPIGVVLITLMLITSISLVVIGSYWISFEFQFEGLAAVALSYLGEPVSNSYSLITLGASIPASSADQNSFGIRWIQATFFIFALAIPLTLLLFLLFLWLVPLSRKSQRKIYIVTEILNAWSAIDVFVISIIAALLEISQFAQFIIGDRCNLINQILADYFSNELNGVDKCFNVVTKLDTGCWLLFGGCISYIISSIVVMRTCHRALENLDKQDKEKETAPIITPEEKPSIQ